MTSKIEYKTSFQDDWLMDNNFKSWISEIENDAFSARCKLCNKTISIAGQGVKALESHEGSMKHKSHLPEKQSKLSYHKTFEKPNRSLLPSNSDTKQSIIFSYSSQQQIAQAEVIWAIGVVLNNYSFNSSSNKSNLFTAMFPDSAIAKYFTCGATKCSYIICFGVAPYMKAILDDIISGLDTYFAVFDESFNKSAKKDKWIYMFASGTRKSVVS